jgi:hypothetical protein
MNEIRKRRNQECHELDETRITRESEKIEAKIYEQISSRNTVLILMGELPALKKTDEVTPNMHFLDLGIGIVRTKKNSSSLPEETEVSEDSVGSRSVSSNERELNKLEKKYKRKQDQYSRLKLLEDLPIMANKLNLAPTQHEKLMAQTQQKITILNNETLQENVKEFQNKLIMGRINADETRLKNKVKAQRILDKFQEQEKLRLSAKLSRYQTDNHKKKMRRGKTTS